MTQDDQSGQQPPPPPGGWPPPPPPQQPPPGYVPAQQPYQPAPPAPPGYGYGQQGAPWPPSSGHPVQLTIERADSQSRALALFSIPFFLVRVIAAIPVLIILYFVGIAMFVVAWIAMWAILFTGHYPVGMHRFVTGVMRWQVRLNAWVAGVTDSYPGFSTAP
jgi:hypothetical protein